MKTLITLLTMWLAAPGAYALDRVQLVQTKIHSSLSAILPTTDYLVIVNRVDSLDDGASPQTVDGTFKQLPGLQLGVDSKGEIVRQDFTSGAYNGPVSINVVIEDKVRAETYKTIEKLLPEIMGGIRDDDEIKMARGPLRQPPILIPTSPQVSIQNGNENKNPMQDNLKFMALLLITGGIFFWFVSRLDLNKGESSPGASNGSDRPHAGNDRGDEKNKGPEVAAADFALLDAEAVALFLMKKVRDKDEETWPSWIQSTPSIHQREVFRFLPSWMLSFLKDASDRRAKSDQPQVLIPLSQLFNEMALVEQSFKTPIQKKKAFLQWFPAQALRFVPRGDQKLFSDTSKRTLWSIRPDLGNFLRVDGMQVEEVMQEPSDQDIENCVRELSQMPTVSFEFSNEGGKSMYLRWVALINQLTEFSPIDSQIEQAKTKLSEKDFGLLLNTVGHLHTPYAFSDSVRKDWLRQVDPNDYCWWLSLSKQTPSWNLKQDLRPMRFAMFNQAIADNACMHWSEEEKKKSSERLLIGFRTLLEAPSTGQDRDAA